MQLMEDKPRIAYLRSLLAWVIGFISMVILSLIALVISPFSPSGDGIHRLGRLWGRIVLWVSGIGVDIQGLEHVNPRQAQVIVSNHQGSFDIWALMAYLPLQFRWVLKKELFRIPFMGPAMRKAGYVGVDRRHPHQAMEDMKKALARLREGKSVLVFPEGTRSRDGRVGEFKRGGFMLAYKAGAPVLPISISGSFGIMPKGSCWIFPRRIKLTIQPPIKVTDLDSRARRQLPEQVRQMIINRMQPLTNEPGNEADNKVAE
jgi:1-acyl-sn-glycerol-3-phosphate acyltransferase